jgi:hypothetical protein
MAGRNRPAAAADGSKEFFEEANRWGTVDVDEEAAAGVDERRSVVGKALATRATPVAAQSWPSEVQVSFFMFGPN